MSEKLCYSTKKPKKNFKETFFTDKEKKEIETVLIQHDILCGKKFSLENTIIYPKIMDAFQAGSKDILFMEHNGYKLLFRYIIGEMGENARKNTPRTVFTNEITEEYPYIQIEITDTGYVIKTRNVFATKREKHTSDDASDSAEINVAEKLDKRIQRCNMSEFTALKEKCKETLRNGKQTASGGAGLGFYDIGRKCKNKFIYDANHPLFTRKIIQHPTHPDRSIFELEIEFPCFDRERKNPDENEGQQKLHKHSL